MALAGDETHRDMVKHPLDTPSGCLEHLIEAEDTNREIFVRSHTQ